MTSNEAARKDDSTDVSTCVTASGKSLNGGRVAAIEAVGQQIILRDQIVRYAERVQDQRAGKSGAILAGGAMNHQRRMILKQVSKQRAEISACFAARSYGRNCAWHLRLRPMTAASRRSSSARRSATTVGSIGSGMNRYFLKSADGGSALLGAAKIERALQA